MYNLLKLREKAKITQASICEVLHVDSKTYRGYEKGGVIPSDVCLKLVEYYSGIFGYKVSIDYLLGIETYKNYDNKFIHEVTKLSEGAIDNIRYEVTHGDNRRVAMLDLLVSNKKTFQVLMNSIVSLVIDVGYHIDEDMLEKTKWIECTKDGAMTVSPSFVRYVIKNSNPDDLYRTMRGQVEEFVDGIDHFDITENEYRCETEGMNGEELEEYLKRERAEIERINKEEMKARKQSGAREED